MKALSFFKKYIYASVIAVAVMLTQVGCGGGGGGGDTSTVQTVSADLNHDLALSADKIITFEMQGDVDGNVIAGISNHDSNDHLYVIGSQVNGAITSIDYIKFEQMVNGIIYSANIELNSNGLPSKMYVENGDYALLTNWTDNSVDISGYDASGKQTQPTVTVLVSEEEIQRLLSLSGYVAVSESARNYASRIDNPVFNNNSRAYEAISLGANIFGCAISGATAAAAWGLTPFTAGTTAAVAIPLTAAAAMSCGSLAVSTAASATDAQWLDTTAAIMDTVGCATGASVSSCTAYASDWLSIATSPTNPQTKIVSPTSDGDIIVQTGDIFTLIAIVNTHYGDVVDATWDFGDGHSFSDMEEEVDYGYNQEGVYTVTFTITYDVGTVVYDQLIVTVTDSTQPANALPAVNAGQDQTVSSGSSVTMTGIASDIDGTIVEYQWSQISGSNVTLFDTDTDSASFTAPVVTSDTSLTFRLTVIDNNGASSSDNVVITVRTTSQVDDTIGGLLAYYEFEGTATDSSGNGNHGTEHNGVSYSSGVIGNAADFDGVDDYITLQTADILFNSTAPSELSVSLWVQIRDTDRSVNVLNTYDDQGHDGYYPVHLQRSINNNFNAAVRYTNSTGHVGTELALDNGTIFSDAEWHHVGYVFSQSQGLIKGYVDGVLKDQSAISQTADYTDNDPVYLGATRFLGIMQQFLDGKVDELRIYGRALSDSEIASLADNVAPTSPPSQGDPNSSLTIDFTGSWNTVTTIQVCTNTESGNWQLSYTNGIYSAYYTSSNGIEMPGCQSIGSYSCNGGNYALEKTLLSEDDIRAGMDTFVSNCLGSVSGGVDSATISNSNSVTISGTYAGSTFTTIFVKAN